MVTLITDRTAADVAKLEGILAKNMRNWTTEESMYFWFGEGAYGGILTAEGDALWTATDAVHAYEGDGLIRGAYNYTDLNRVTAAMDDLHGRLTAYGYRTGYAPFEAATGRRTWQEGDIPTREQMEDYLANLRSLKGVLDLLATTPKAPADMEGLTIAEANNIEQILVDLDFQVTTMATTFIPCGEAICGGDNL